MRRLVLTLTSGVDFDLDLVNARVWDGTRTKVTPNPPPRVDYKALYSWASDELLNECTALTTIRDVEDHRGDPLLYNFNAYCRTHDAHISIRQGTPGEPVCVHDRSRGGKPFFSAELYTFFYFIYHFLCTLNF